MSLRVLSVVGVVAAVAVSAMVGASGARADGSAFDALRGDITSSSLPAVQQRSFLERATLAENFLSPLDPGFPPSPCAATAQLDSLGFSTTGLLRGRQISQEDASTLIGDVTHLNDTIVYGSDYPPSPCQVSFLDTLSGDS